MSLTFQRQLLWDQIKVVWVNYVRNGALTQLTQCSWALLL